MFKSKQKKWNTESFVLRDLVEKYASIAVLFQLISICILSCTENPIVFHNQQILAHCDHMATILMRVFVKYANTYEQPKRRDHLNLFIPIGKTQ